MRKLILSAVIVLPMAHAQFSGGVFVCSNCSEEATQLTNKASLLTQIQKQLHQFHRVIFGIFKCETLGPADSSGNHQRCSLIKRRNRWVAAVIQQKSHKSEIAAKGCAQ